MIHFDLPKQKSSIIKVIGVGGGGSNAVNYMYAQNIEGVDFADVGADVAAFDVTKQQHAHDDGTDGGAEGVDAAGEVETVSAFGGVAQQDGEWVGRCLLQRETERHNKEGHQDQGKVTEGNRLLVVSIEGVDHFLEAGLGEDTCVLMMFFVFRESLRYFSKQVRVVDVFISRFVAGDQQCVSVFFFFTADFHLAVRRLQLLFYLETAAVAQGFLNGNDLFFVGAGDHDR